MPLRVLALTLFMDETSKNNFDTLFKAQTQEMTPHSKEIQNLRIKWCELFNSYFLPLIHLLILFGISQF